MWPRDIICSKCLADVQKWEWTKFELETESTKMFKEMVHRFLVWIYWSQKSVELFAQEQHVLLPGIQVEGPRVGWTLLIASTMFRKNDTIYLVNDQMQGDY